MFGFDRRPAARALAVAILATVAAATAQPRPPPASPTPAPASLVPSAPPAPAASSHALGVGPFQALALLSPALQTAEADRVVARMATAAGTIRKSLAEAKRKQDVLKTSCLLDKSLQYEGALRAARDRRFAMTDAVTHGDRDLATHLLTILTVLQSRTEQLRGEADMCPSDEAVFFDETTVQVTAPAPAPSEAAPGPPR